MERLGRGSSQVLQKPSVPAEGFCFSGFRLIDLVFLLEFQLESH
jgi:hypothetical protein